MADEWINLYYASKKLMFTKIRVFILNLLRNQKLYNEPFANKLLLSLLNFYRSFEVVLIT